MKSVLASSRLLNPAIDNPTEKDVVGELKASCEQFELELIRKALSTAEGDRREAAKQLAVPVRTLYQKCQKYGLQDGT